MAPLKKQGSSKGNGGLPVPTPIEMVQHLKRAQVIALLGTARFRPQPSLGSGVQRELAKDDRRNRKSPVEYWRED